MVCLGVTRESRAHNLWTQIRVGVANLLQLTTRAALSTLIGMWRIHVHYADSELGTLRHPSHKRAVCASRRILENMDAALWSYVFVQV